MANRITTVFEFSEKGSGLRKIKADVEATEGSFNKMKVASKGAMAELANNRVAQAAVAGIAVKIGKDAVMAASNLEESLNAVNVAYGESAAAVTALGETSAESFGLSQRAFNEFAVQFSSFANQVANKDGRAVSDVVQEMTGRVADFASVMNLDVADAARIFQSGLAGETEPLRKFGVDLSAAAVEAYALANGLAASKSEIDESIKVQARYGLLMESTAKTAGDFKNTQDGLANSTRTLQAQTEDLQATLGKQLLPAAEAVTGALVNMGEALKSVDQFTLAMTGGQQGLGDIIGGTVQQILTGNGALQEATKRLWETNDATKAYDESLSLTADELERSIAILNGQSSSLGEAADATADLEDRQRRAATAADMHRRKLRDLVDQIGGLKDEIDDRRAWLNLEASFEDIVSQGIDVTNMSRDQELAILSLKDEVLDYAASIDLPERVVTEILAEIDRGGISEVEGFLQRWGRGVTVPIRPAVIGTVSGSILTEGGRRVGARASGGPVSSGRTYLVGEKGPELLTMGGNGYVTPNNALPSTVGAGSQTFNINVVAPAGSNADEFGRAVWEAIRREARWRGPVAGVAA